MRMMVILEITESHRARQRYKYTQLCSSWHAYHTVFCLGFFLLLLLFWYGGLNYGAPTPIIFISNFEAMSHQGAQADLQLAIFLPQPLESLGLQLCATKMAIKELCTEVRSTGFGVSQQHSQTGLFIY